MGQLTQRMLILQVPGGSSLAAVCFPAVFIGEVIGLIHILFIWLTCFQRMKRQALKQHVRREDSQVL